MCGEIKAMTKMCYFCCNYTNNFKFTERGACLIHCQEVRFGDECDEFDKRPISEAKLYKEYLAKMNLEE